MVGPKFGWGFAIGLIGALLALSPGLDALPLHVARAFGIAVVTGLLAARYTDRVWAWLARMLEW
jgi:hypothetical protein